MSLCSYEFISIAVLFNVCNLEQGSDDDEKEDQKKKLEKRSLTFEGAASHQKILEISESLSLDADGGESDDDGNGNEDDNEFSPNIPEYPAVNIKPVPPLQSFQPTQAPKPI